MRSFPRLYISAFVALAGIWLLPSLAAAEQIQFTGAHPIPSAVEGDFCYIEVPHVHIYEPDDAELLYRQHDEHHHFVGDPVAYGFDGPKHTYYGHHPIQLDVSVHVDVHTPVVEYCYLDGPHFHHHPPPVDINFELKGGAYWYIGKYPRPYLRKRKRLRRINVVYEPIAYVRPKVIVEAPVGYLGPVVEVNIDAPVVEVEAPARRVRAGAAVRAGVDIDVHIPVPSVSIDVSVPGVVVHKRHKKYRKHRKHKKHRKRRHWRH